MSFLIVFKLFQTNLIIVKLEKLLIEKNPFSVVCVELEIDGDCP